MENSTPCKIVTPENFILKLGTRDYVENITHYTRTVLFGVRMMSDIIWGKCAQKTPQKGA